MSLSELAENFPEVSEALDGAYAEVTARLMELLTDPATGCRLKKQWLIVNIEIPIKRCVSRQLETSSSPLM
ncbi:MAG: hypothetical protein LBD85_05565 [Oscillospiraceae bacterium]|nr:hypothetical protein [Oscillospiraceae bacterium]